MTREEIVAFVARRERALKEHDIPAIVEEHTEDCVLHSPIAGTVHGREAIGQAFHAWFESFPDSTYQVDDLFVDNRRVDHFLFRLDTLVDAHLTASHPLRLDTKLFGDDRYDKFRTGSLVGIR